MECIYLFDQPHLDWERFEKKNLHERCSLLFNLSRKCVLLRYHKIYKIILRLLSYKTAD